MPIQSKLVAVDIEVKAIDYMKQNHNIAFIYIMRQSILSC